MDAQTNGTFIYNGKDSNSSVQSYENESGFLDDYRISPALQQQDEFPLATVVPLAVSLGLLILFTVIGNAFVLAAICRERHLQTVGNYLVFSLAVADLMVACLVMPLGALYEVTGRRWVLGAQLCEVWTSGDVLCCTASILHLVAIALDRYWAVTNIDYVRHRSAWRIGIMIALIWGVSFLVSFAPVFGWKDDGFLQRIQEDKQCLVSQDAGYQIFATCSTFYVPLVVILLLYWKIYQVARKRIRHKPGHSVRPATFLPLVANNSSMNSTAFNSANEATPQTEVKKKRESIESKRERKAAKTLAIITGVFVVCWVPFFATALLMALCATCQPDPWLFSLFLWLGYANSTLNPLLYTLFSPDFRKAFARVLRGKKKPK